MREWTKFFFFMALLRFHTSLSSSTEMFNLNVSFSAVSAVFNQTQRATAIVPPSKCHPLASILSCSAVF